MQGKREIMTNSTQTRMQRLGYRKPDDVPEPEQLVLVEYVADGCVALITLIGRALRKPRFFQGE
jgi:hypothetical protein